MYKRRLALAFIDALSTLAVCYFILVIYPSGLTKLTGNTVMLHIAMAMGCIFLCRLLFRVYRQIWRYAGSTEYMRLMASDFLRGPNVLYAWRVVPPIQDTRVVCARGFARSAITPHHTGNPVFV